MIKIRNCDTWGTQRFHQWPLYCSQVCALVSRYRNLWV